MEVISELLPLSRTKKLKVGLLGGSFDPAHSGHLHISSEAISLLGLDLVIWLVSPQNPFKSADMRDSLERRMRYAKMVTELDPQILVSDIEKHFPTTYTADTINILKSY